MSERSIAPWTKMPCDGCGSEYLASRTQRVTGTEFLCAFCDGYERAVQDEKDVRDSLEKHRDRLQAENTRLVLENREIRAKPTRAEAALREIVATETWAGQFCGTCKSCVGRNQQLVEMAKAALTNPEPEGGDDDEL